MATPTKQFDLRLRPLQPGQFRCVLLPHRRVEGQPLVDAPWSWAKNGKAKWEGSKPVDPRLPGAFWLPPVGTTLDVAAPGVDFGARIHRLTVEGGDEPEPRWANGSGGQKLVCFDGLKVLLDDDKVRENIASARGAKEFLLTLIEAFRFEGTIEEYARIGDVELLAALSHLVFEVHFTDHTSAAAKAFDDYEKWNKGTVTVAIPKEEAALEEEAADGPFSIFAPQPRKSTEGEERPHPIPIEVIQRADGVYFRLLDPGFFDALDGSGNRTGKPDDQFRLMLRRSEGSIPLENPPIIEPSYWGLDKVEMDAKDPNGPAEADKKSVAITSRTYHVIDRHDAERFAGQQLHYRLDVIDGFGERYATAAVTLRRERFDPPPQPVSSVAQLVIPATAQDRLKFVVELEFLHAGVTSEVFPTAAVKAAPSKQVAVSATSQKEITEEFALELFQQERPLDACGFYGDDDDFALLEGLRQADANYQPRETGAESPFPGHPLEEQMRGRFDRDGLSEIRIEDEAGGAGQVSVKWFSRLEDLREEEKKNGQLPRELAVARYEISFAENAPPTWLRARHGYHVFAALARKRLMEVHANLSACRHELVFSDLPPSEGRVGVFQIELFPVARAFEADLAENRRFLTATEHEQKLPGYFGIGLLRDQPAPTEPGGRKFVPEADAAALTEGGPGAVPTGVEVVLGLPIAGSADFEGAILGPSGTPVAGPPEPIGGVRILMRDQVAAGEALPFRVVESVQVLPRAVAQYRPVQIEAGMKLVPRNPQRDPVFANAAERSDPSTQTQPGSSAVAWFGPGGLVAILRKDLQELVGELETDFSERAADMKELGREEVKTDVFEGDAATLQERADAWYENTRKALKIDLGPLEAIEAQEGANRARIDQIERLLALATTPPEEKERLTQEKDRLDRELFNLSFDFEHWWPAMGAMLTMLRELGLTRDLVVRLSQMEEAWERIQKVAATMKSHFKIVAIESADGELMATIRVAVMPWAERDAADPSLSLLEKIFPPPGGANVPDPDDLWRELYGFLIASERLVLFRDVSRAPLNLTLHAGRLVRYRWHGLRDFWHHDLEVAVQLLDRYQHIRDRYLRQDAAANRRGNGLGVPDEGTKAQQIRRENLKAELDDRIELADPLVSTAVARVVVPRREPLGKAPGIFPAAKRPPYLIAFEFLDTEERQKASHNALVRTRGGNLQTHLPWQVEFPDAPLYTAVAGALKYCRSEASPTFALWWADRLRAAGVTLKAGACLLPHDKKSTAIRVKDKDLLAWAGENPQRMVATVPPRPLCDVIALPNEPHYLTFHQGCYLGADYLTSETVWASATREPWRLGLPFVPIFWFGQADPTGLPFTIRFTPALLGSALAKDELRHATGLERLEVAGDTLPKEGLLLASTPAGISTSGERQNELPIPLLPDLRMEYAWLLDLGGQKFVPLFEWKAERRNGDLATPLTDKEDRPLGFLPPTALAPALVSNLAAQWVLIEGALVELTGKLTFSDPALYASLQSTPANSLHLMLRRGGLSTNFLPLIHQPPQ
jgi:hypothetical protein